MNRDDLRKTIYECLDSEPKATYKDLKSILYRVFEKKYGAYHRITVDDLSGHVFRKTRGRNIMMKGKIEKCDPIEPDHVIETAFFSIDDNNNIKEVMTWTDKPIILTLNMDNLSRDDLVDIKNIGNPKVEIDLYRTFMRIPSNKRGVLAEKIDNCIEYFPDIPPYCFCNYGEYFLHRSKPVGDLGGGMGFGGFRMEKGTVLEMKPRVISIGDHAFDGCKNLTEVSIPDNTAYIGHKAFSNTPGLTINCSMLQKPDNWEDDWCDEDCKVNWGVPSRDILTWGI